MKKDANLLRLAAHLRVYLCRRQYYEEDFTMQHHELASDNIFPPLPNSPCNQSLNESSE